MNEKMTPLEVQKAETLLSKLSKEKLLSSKREHIVGRLAPKSMELFRRCNLRLEDGKIIGTIEGKEVHLIKKQTGNEPGQSTINGSIIMPSLANQLYEKYLFIARIQGEANRLENDPEIIAEALAQELLNL
ncbi:MAG: hypothetical protein Q8O46_01715 [bacterium]|nr:hypothetical protein [bacterium]